MCSLKTFALSMPLVWGACGRVNYEAQPQASVDSGVISAPSVDAGVADAEPLLPPAEMRFVTGDAGSYYIDIVESGSASWLVGTEICGGQGKRYCTGEEWDTACFAMGTELMGMDPQNGWEWVAEVQGTSGYKRLGCGEIGTHNINTDPYQVRCCQDAP